MSFDVRSLRDEVERLFEFRDTFFAQHDKEKAFQKNKDVLREMEKSIEKLDNAKDGIPNKDKAEYFFLKGKALNVGENYSKDAEEQLGRATKFNYPPAWNELGECLYKKGDHSGAKICFEKAIALEQEPVYYRNLSMLMRSLPAKDTKERETNINKGLELAKEALKLNYSDGHSWLVLGNSYLTLFFTFGAKQDVLKNCKSAYTKAEEDARACLLPELHYSKFQIEWYEEDYPASLRSLRKACELEPTWDDPKEKLDHALKFLSRVSSLVHTSGKMTAKKIAAFISGIKSSHLGPYEDGGTSLTGGAKPLLTTFSLLAEGNNENKVVVGCVVSVAVPESGIPFVFCAVDKDAVCRAVTVYNWAGRCGVKIGDYVAIVAPTLKRHDLSTENIKEFYSFRVILPLMLVINKRSVSHKEILGSNVVSSKKSD